ncbi:hypothetical protein CIHG_10128 [Coccidioides immitis H538.4]|uniref:Uncharacterized protein n=3 Tax=Coccidioides immitis TaxID=5501 RepID=A0A0J8RA21_COCIT|nr:hypothetical protein CIRG_09866 [Coccidioides immitis RMSCC 2394]KMU81939.1 hypothetical protein CISG_09321 [Coccidioides immitis RMSCC 3703]KMU92331.1 hypothetical protein CIHG_10128 [Coccidioides immitis H538.4]
MQSYWYAAVGSYIGSLATDRFQCLYRLELGRTSSVSTRCLHHIMSAENKQDSVKRDSVSSADYDPVIFEAIKANANERKQLSTSGKAAQQARFARGAEELDNAVKRAVDKDVIAAAGKTGDTGGNNPR